ncbi:protein FAM184A-like [Cheilinus undulatus]|uniref:protein FAM184A-like n=1 Tax=Cheilinus undulatus TaxID=241271 RepID=UPI001BD66310|nr:protein FAM184A-like [Cheilinus undulatus]
MSSDEDLVTDGGSSLSVQACVDMEFNQELYLRMKKKLDHQEQVISELNAKNDKLEENIVSVKEDNKRLRGIISKTTEMVEQCKAEITEKNQQIKSLEDSVAHQVNLKKQVEEFEIHRKMMQETELDTEAQQIQSLKETLLKERQSHKKEVDRIRAHSKVMEAIHAQALKDVEKKHRVIMKRRLKEAERDKIRMLHEQMVEFQTERLALKEQKRIGMRKLDELREVMDAKLNAAKQEVIKLQQEVQQRKKDIGAAEGQISTLMKAQKKLMLELDAGRSNLRETSNQLTALQEELESQKHQCEARVVAAIEEEKLKWIQSFKQEFTKLQQKLREKHEQEKVAALALLTQTKDQELNSAKEKWQQEAVDLAEQISLLKLGQEMHLAQMQSLLDNMKQQLSQEKEQAKILLDKLQGKHQWQLQHLKEIHHKTVQDMESTYQRDLEEQREHLYCQHRAELQILNEEHCREMQVFKQESKHELRELKIRLEKRTNSMLFVQQSELKHMHASAIEQLEQRYQQESAAAKAKLEKTVENNRQEQREMMNRITELQEELFQRKEHITQLEHQNQELNENISTLNKELGEKDNEVLQIRSEANKSIKAHKQELLEKHREELASLGAAHNTEIQDMLADFNRHEDVFKNIICNLQSQVEVTEKRFRNRESRPEDLQLIAGLKASASEKDSQIEKLEKGRKTLLLELNYMDSIMNKFFHGSPNVRATKQVTEQQRVKKTAASRSNVKALDAAGAGIEQALSPLPGQPKSLEPIPNSRTHNFKFNSYDPLPQLVMTSKPKESVEKHPEPKVSDGKIKTAHSFSDAPDVSTLQPTAKSLTMPDSGSCQSPPPMPPEANPLRPHPKLKTVLLPVSPIKPKTFSRNRSVRPLCPKY